VQCGATKLTQNHQARSPRMDANIKHPQVQYNTSHIYSVRPLASKSSPALFNSPGSAPYSGRPIFSSQNSIAAAGVLRRRYRSIERREKEERNMTARRSRKMIWRINVIRCVCLRRLLLRDARVLAAFCKCHSQLESHSAWWVYLLVP
jgi:hypothetical protein